LRHNILWMNIRGGRRSRIRRRPSGGLGPKQSCTTLVAKATAPTYYGSTYFGGVSDDGVVFSLTPTQSYGRRMDRGRTLQFCRRQRWGESAVRKSGRRRSAPGSRRPCRPIPQQPFLRDILEQRNHRKHLYFSHCKPSFNSTIQLVKRGPESTLRMIRALRTVACRLPRSSLKSTAYRSLYSSLSLESRFLRAPRVAPPPAGTPHLSASVREWKRRRELYAVREGKPD
jgi:hypothetical protein